MSNFSADAQRLKKRNCILATIRCSESTLDCRRRRKLVREKGKGAVKVQRKEGGVARIDRASRQVGNSFR